MINSYEIKIKNNEEILCIYFDFSLEFAKLKGKAKKKKINNIVKEFIKENNINFHGKKIAIIAGGLLIGTLVLNKPVQTYETNFTTNKIVSIFSPIKIDEVASQESSIITSESIIYDNIEKNEDTEYNAVMYALTSKPRFFIIYRNNKLKYINGTRIIYEIFLRILT